MNLTRTLLIVLSALLLAPAVLADDSERPEHYKGLPAATLEQAVQNLNTYNQKLASLVTKDELTPSEMADIHQITYTLENALAKINAELAQMGESLEAVHLASEKLQYDTVRQQGAGYLSIAEELFPQK